MFKNWHNSFAPDLQIIILVGENMSTQPSTPQDAKNYKAQHGYPDGIEVVADPKWMKISQAVNHGGTSIALPFLILFDTDMTILSVGAGAQTIQNKLMELTGKQPVVPQGTCEGSCGNKSAAGCYCDNECKNFGDCCGDVCNVCGFC